jgi:hypothetical protein
VAAEVRMSVEEYLEIMRIIGEQGPGIVQGVREVKKQGRKLARSVKKRTGKKDPKMAKALKQANDKARKKNGDFKKGFDQSKLMSLAHKIRRKM